MTAAPTLIVETFPVGPLQCNCTILGCPTTKEAVVVDPGGDAPEILERLAAKGLKVTKVLHTHAHLDHFLASGEIKKATGATLHLHRGDKDLWDNLETQCRVFGVRYVPQPAPDEWMAHEEGFKVGGSAGVAIHTPGHTPGSMCFHVESAKLMIAGDTLFRGSIGRTDLWGGDHKAIVSSIRERVYACDDDTAVVTGHGPGTTIGQEKRTNAFVRA